MRKKKKKNNANQNEEVIRRYSCQSVQKCDIGVTKIKNPFKFSKKKTPTLYNTTQLKGAFDKPEIQQLL